MTGEFRPSMPRAGGVIANGSMAEVLVPIELRECSAHSLTAGSSVASDAMQLEAAGPASPPRRVCHQLLVVGCATAAIVRQHGRHVPDACLDRLIRTIASQGAAILVRCNVLIVKALNGLLFCTEQYTLRY